MSLPPKMSVGDFPGADFTERWKGFLDGIYQVFLKTVANGGLRFQGLPVKCRYHPPYDDKHFSFWHLMSEGKAEAERTPDLERCARVSWIAWVIQNADKPDVVRWWENERSTGHGLKTHVPLWFVEQNYVVILEKRADFYLLLTTYCLRGHQIEKFEKEWKTWTTKKAEAAGKAASVTPSTHG
jgi:hypothetical protein